MKDLSRSSARKLKRLRRIATGIRLFRKTNNAGFLTIARIPERLMRNPSWREEHLLQPAIRHRIRTTQGAL